MPTCACSFRVGRRKREIRTYVFCDPEVKWRLTFNDLPAKIEGYSEML